MVLQSGAKLLAEQTIALTKKNFIVSRRNKRSTFIQMFSSFFFLLTMFSIEELKDYQDTLNTGVPETRDPQPLVSPPIPPCEEQFYVKLPCYDFLWSGNKSTTVQTIVQNIMANNPGRRIPPSKVKSFETQREVDEWLYNNPMRCPGALHFSVPDPKEIRYGVQTNRSSSDLEMQNQFEDTTFKFELPLQLAAEREIARLIIGDPNFSWTVGLKKFAHPKIRQLDDYEETYDKEDAKKRRTERDYALTIFGSTFFFASSMFRFVFQISSLVIEKELKLRQAMSMMGLYDTAYWCSWLIWETIMNLLSSLLLIFFGFCFQMKFFRTNSFVVLYLLFFLFQLSMSGFAFMLSTFQRKSALSASLGFAIFIIGYLTMGISKAIYKTSAPKDFRTLWSLFPPNLFGAGLSSLLQKNNEGISWSNRAILCVPADEKNCVMSIDDVYKGLASAFFLWFTLAIYFDNIFPNAVGIGKPAFYFLKPSYWTESGENEDHEASSCFSSANPPHENTPDDEDVLEEENRVKQQAKEGAVDPEVAVQIRRLIKTYPASRHFSCYRCCCCCFCCGCKKIPEFHACKGIWMNFARDQCFCLLGPNGAGKTTIINCLTGILPATSGDAIIYGHSIRSMRGMSKVRKIIGVCPQFDILWSELSGKENLQLFASIKGLPRNSIEMISEKLLADVGLEEEATVRVSSYSGGMKRRISIAIALIGDPQLVILDEPTTGMDPITRRSVWDVIEKAKAGRAIVLTTHSMEEADVLGDRIGIMVKGRLRCIGSSIRLKSRFGTGFIVTVTFSENLDHNSSTTTTKKQRDAVKIAFKTHLNVLVKEDSNMFQTYIIPLVKDTLLLNLFADIEPRKEELGISDIQVRRSTLEEVFLNIIKKTELELATAEGKTATLTLRRGTSLLVPIGAKYVAIPGTETSEHPNGFMIEAFWNQDDTGALYNTGHSKEIPIPRHAKLRAQTIPVTRKLGRKGPQYGLIVDIN